MSERRCHPFDLEEQDRRDAALEAVQFADQKEQEWLDYEADLRYEYSKPEYHDENQGAIQ